MFPTNKFEGWNNDEVDEWQDEGQDVGDEDAEEDVFRFFYLLGLTNSFSSSAWMRSPSEWTQWALLRAALDNSDVVFTPTLELEEGMLLRTDTWEDTRADT